MQLLGTVDSGTKVPFSEEHRCLVCFFTFLQYGTPNQWWVPGSIPLWGRTSKHLDRPAWVASLGTLIGRNADFKRG